MPQSLKHRIPRRLALKIQELTGAMVKVAIAAARGTFEKVLVCVAVAWVIWTNAVGTILKPPAEHVEKPRKSMNDCWPLASRITLPDADDRISVYAEGSVVGAPEFVTQTPFDS